MFKVIVEFTMIPSTHKQIAWDTGLKTVEAALDDKSANIQSVVLSVLHEEDEAIA